MRWKATEEPQMHHTKRKKPVRKIGILYDSNYVTSGKGKTRQGTQVGVARGRWGRRMS